jgi:hypothetical protein
MYVSPSDFYGVQSRHLVSVLFWNHEEIAPTTCPGFLVLPNERETEGHFTAKTTNFKD